MNNASKVALTAMADSLDAGLSLGTLAEDPSMRLVLGADAARHLSMALRAGRGVSEGLLAAGLLDTAGASVIAAGERGGFLPRALRAAAAAAAAAHARRRKALMALAYPALLLVAANVVLPLPMLVTQGVGAYLTRALPPAFFVVGVLLLVFVVFPRLPPRARDAVMGAAARAPFLGGVIVDGARAAVLDVLGQLLTAGVSAQTAVPAALGGGLARWRAHAAHTPTQLGAGLATSLGPSGLGVLDDATVARVALGEQSGKLDVVLPMLASEARERSQRRFTQLSVGLGLVSFLLVAGVAALGIIDTARGAFDAIDAATKE